VQDTGSSQAFLEGNANALLRPTQSAENLRDRIFDTEAVFLAQNRNAAVLNELVRPADADNGRVNASVTELFYDPCAESVAKHMVFECADDLHFFGEGFKAGHVEGLDPARVDECDGETFGFEFCFGSLGDREHVAKSDKGNVVAICDDFGLADFEKDRLVLRRDAGAVAARIADGNGSTFVIRHGPEHVHELIFIPWLHVDETWNATEVGDVEEAVMSGAVVTAETATVHAHAHREVLDGHVMQDHVESTLHEGGVDREEGLQATRGQATGKKGGVLLGDPYVEIALRNFFFKYAQASAAWHSTGDGDDFLIRLGEVGDTAGKDLGVGRLVTGGGFAGFDAVFPKAMEFARVIERRGVATAFLSDDVKDHRLILSFEKLEGLNEQREVVTVDGTVVTNTEFIEQNAAIGGRLALGKDDVLGVALDFFSKTTRTFTQHELDEFGGLLMQVRESGMGGDGIEVLRDGTDIAVDGPLVVIEDNDESLGMRSDVVERFKHRTAGESGVTGDADDVLVTTGKITSSGHAERGGEGGASMPRAVTVVLAFGAQKEAVETIMLPNGVNAVPAACEHLMDVALVRDIEHKAVLGCVEDPVHGEGQLDDAKIRAQMAAGLAERFNERLTDFFRKLGKPL